MRHDGIDKVTGRAKYGADYSYPDMLHGKVLRSPHAHARIKSINLEKALASAGVKAIVTGKDLVDLPGRRAVDGRDDDESARHLAQHPGARQGDV